MLAALQRDIQVLSFVLFTYYIQTYWLLDLGKLGPHGTECRVVKWGHISHSPTN